MYWIPLLGTRASFRSCDSPETGFTSLLAGKLRARVGDGAKQAGDYCYAWRVEEETNQLEPMMEVAATTTTAAAALDDRGIEWENEKKK